MPCEKLYTKSKDLTKILKCAKVKIMTKPTRLRPSQGGKFHAPVGPAPEVVAEVRAEDPANRIFRGKDGTIEIWREARPRLGECLDYIPGFEVARPSYDCSEKDGVRSALIVRYPPECPKTGQMIRVRFEDGIELLQRFRGWSHYADDAHQFLDFSDRM